MDKIHFWNQWRGTFEALNWQQESLDKAIRRIVPYLTKNISGWTARPSETFIGTKFATDNSANIGIGISASRGISFIGPSGYHLTIPSGNYSVTAENLASANISGWIIFDYDYEQNSNVYTALLNSNNGSDTKPSTGDSRTGLQVNAYNPATNSTCATYPYLVNLIADNPTTGYGHISAVLYISSATPSFTETTAKYCMNNTDAGDDITQKKKFPFSSASHYLFSAGSGESSIYFTTATTYVIAYNGFQHASATPTGSTFQGLSGRLDTFYVDNILKHSGMSAIFSLYNSENVNNYGGLGYILPKGSLLFSNNYEHNVIKDMGFELIGTKLDGIVCANQSPSGLFSSATFTNTLPSNAGYTPTHLSFQNPYIYGSDIIATHLWYENKDSDNSKNVYMRVAKLSLSNDNTLNITASNFSDSYLIAVGAAVANPSIFTAIDVNSGYYSSIGLDNFYAVMDSSGKIYGINTTTLTCAWSYNVSGHSGIAGGMYINPSRNKLYIAGGSNISANSGVHITTASLSNSALTAAPTAYGRLTSVLGCPPCVSLSWVNSGSKYKDDTFYFSTYHPRYMMTAFPQNPEPIILNTNQKFSGGYTGISLVSNSKISTTGLPNQLVLENSATSSEFKFWIDGYELGHRDNSFDCFYVAPAEPPTYFALTGYNGYSYPYDGITCGIYGPADESSSYITFASGYKTQGLTWFGVPYFGWTSEYTSSNSGNYYITSSHAYAPFVFADQGVLYIASGLGYEFGLAKVSTLGNNANGHSVKLHTTRGADRALYNSYANNQDTLDYKPRFFDKIQRGMRINKFSIQATVNRDAPSSYYFQINSKYNQNIIYNTVYPNGITAMYRKWDGQNFSLKPFSSDKTNTWLSEINSFKYWISKNSVVFNTAMFVYMNIQQFETGGTIKYDISATTGYNKNFRFSHYKYNSNTDVKYDITGGNSSGTCAIACANVAYNTNIGDYPWYRLSVSLSGASAGAIGAVFWNNWYSPIVNDISINYGDSTDSYTQRGINQFYLYDEGTIEQLEDVPYRTMGIYESSSNLYEFNSTVGYKHLILCYDGKSSNYNSSTYGQEILAYDTINNTWNNLGTISATYPSTVGSNSIKNGVISGNSLIILGSSAKAYAYKLYEALPMYEKMI